MKSFRSRLSIWYILVIAGTLSIVLFSGRLLLEQELVHGIDLLNAAEWKEIQEKIINMGGTPMGSISPESLTDVVRHAKIDKELYYFQIRNSDKILFQSQNLNGVVLPSDPPGIRTETRQLGALGELRLSYFESNGLKVVIASSLTPIYHLMASYTQVSLIMLGMVLFLSIIFGYSLSLIALAPINRIQRIADRIRGDNLTERIPDIDSNDEIAQLTRLLNQMFDRLEISFRQLQRFAGEASHELKTPLVLIRLQSEKLLLHGDLNPEQQEALQQQLESIAKLGTVINKLLFLARSEVGVTRINPVQIQSKVFIDNFFEDAHALCDDREMNFVIERNDSGVILIDPPLIRQVLLNLISNSLNASQAGSTVSLSSCIEKNIWRVVIEDSGIGVPYDELERIFDPFIRGKTGHAMENASGLGLSICKSILFLHGGKIWAESRAPSQGLRVIFQVDINA